jgi:hypothetical protein
MGGEMPLDIEYPISGERMGFLANCRGEQKTYYYKIFIDKRSRTMANKWHLYRYAWICMTVLMIDFSLLKWG